MTAAHNICVARSNAYNDRGGPDDRICEAADCANSIAAWVSPTDDQLAEMFKEAGVYVERGFMAEALNSGDGIYRP